MLLLGDGGSSCLPRVSRLRCLLWGASSIICPVVSHSVKPIGPILIRLEPNWNPKFPLGDNLASGMPFQPMTLCKFDCHYGKNKTVSEKNYWNSGRSHRLPLPCQVLFQCLSAPFSRKQWGSPQDIASVFLPIFLPHWRGDGAVSWLVSELLRKGIKWLL